MSGNNNKGYLQVSVRRMDRENASVATYTGSYMGVLQWVITDDRIVDHIDDV